MLDNEKLDRAKQAFNNGNFEEALILFRAMAICGNALVLKDVGRAMLCNNRRQIIDTGELNGSTRKGIIAYLSAALMYEKNARACIDMVKTNRYSDDLEYEKSHYYLRLSRQNVKKEDEDALLLSIQKEEEAFNYRFHLVQSEEPLNDLDYFCAIAGPFWVVRYRENASTNAILERCTSKITQERFNACSIDPHSRKKMAAWDELKRHLNCPFPVLYLIYVEGEFNRSEVVKLIADTMRLCGCEIKLYKWKSINAIPEEVVLLVLGDSALFAESQKPVAEQAPYYQRIQQHTGKRIWIPWQIPAEISLPEYWTLLPQEWQSGWISLKTSLLHDPLETLDTMMGYLLENKENSLAIKHLQALSRTSFSELYKNKSEYRGIITNLIANKSDPVNFNTFFDLMLDLRNKSKNLYQYLVPENSVYVICEKYGIENTYQLAQHIRELKNNNTEHCDILVSLATKLLKRFKREQLKTTKLFREISYLAYTQHPEIMKILFSQFFYYFPVVATTDDLIEILSCLTLTLGLIPMTQLDKGDLLTILHSLMNHLASTHVQENDEKKAYYLLKAISLILILLKCIGIKNVSREIIEERYYTYLKKLKNQVSNSLIPLVEQTIAVLKIIPNDETLTDELKRRTAPLVLFVIKIVTAFFPHPSLASPFLLFESLRHLSEVVKGISSSRLGDSLRDFKLIVIDLNLSRGVNSLDNVEFFLHNLEKKTKILMLLAAVGMLDDFVVQPHNIPHVHVAVVELIFKMVQWTRDKAAQEVEAMQVMSGLIHYLVFYSQMDKKNYPDLSVTAKKKLKQLGIKDYNFRIAPYINPLPLIEKNTLLFSTKIDLENSNIFSWFCEIFDKVGEYKETSLCENFVGNFKKNSTEASNKPDLYSIYMLCQSYEIENTFQLANVLLKLKNKNPEQFNVLANLDFEIRSNFEKMDQKSDGLFYEMACLSYSEHPLVMQDLFRKFFYLVTATEKLMTDDAIDLCDGLILLLRMMITSSQLHGSMVNDLMIMLDSLLIHAKNSHCQHDFELKFYYFLRAINLILVIMKKINISNIQNEYANKNYKELKLLENSATENLKPTVLQAVTGINKIPNCSLRFADIFLSENSQNLLKTSMMRSLDSMTDSGPGEQLCELQLLLLDSKINQPSQTLENCKNFLNGVLSKKIEKSFVLGSMQLFDSFLIHWHYFSCDQVLIVELIGDIISWAKHHDPNNKNDKIKEIYAILFSYLDRYSKANGQHEELAISAQKKLDVLKKENSYFNKLEGQHPISLLNNRKESNQLFIPAKKAVEERQVLQFSTSRLTVYNRRDKKEGEKPYGFTANF